MPSTPVGKWGSYSLVISTDNSFSTAGDNTVIPGLTFTPSASEIAITGLSQTITTAAKNYFLVVNIDPAAAGTGYTPSLGAANATATTGTFSGTATGTSYSFAPILTIANLSTGLAGSPLIAGATNQGVFGFSLTSNGSQTVTVANIQLSSNPSGKWSNYKLITSTDASYSTGGDNSAPIAGLTFTPSAGQVAITGLNETITTGTNYFLVVDINAAATGATTAIQPSLAAANVTVSTGVATGSGTGTNYNFSTATATFAQIATGIAASPLSAGAPNQAVIGFSASSNSTQSFTAINIQFSSNPSSKWGSYSLVRSTDNSYSTAGDNTTIPGLTFTPSATQVAITGLTETLTGTAKNYFLVVTADPSATTATAAIQPSFTQANITVVGSVAAVSITGTNYSFNTSQSSDIILNGGTTDNIDYINRRTGNPLSSGNSASLATFRIRDGGSTTDTDNASTTLTGLQIQLTGTAAGMVRRIALFDGGSIIAGTQQDVSGANITWSGLSLTANDGGTKDFTVRATFISTPITDNTIVDVTIQSASVTAAATGSGFTTITASSTSAASADANKIEVTATALAFTGNPPNTTINTPFSLSIRAVDAQNNIDLDYNSEVELNSPDATTGILSDNGVNVASPNAPLAPVTLVNGAYNWTLLRLSQSGTYTLKASDNPYDDNFSDPTATVIITSSASSISQANPAAICYGNTNPSAVPSIPTAFFPLGNIAIAETDPAGISGTNGTYTFSISLPTGFVFDQSVLTGVSVSAGSDVTIPGGTQYTYPSANTVQFSYTLSGTSNTQTITIGGLKFGSPHPQTSAPTGTGSQTITRSGGSGIIAGVAAGTVLGNVSASWQNVPIDFTVDQALVTDPPIDPNTTTFNVSGSAVKLEMQPTIATGTTVFSGSGVSFVNPDYRFNPSSLSAGLYPITVTHTKTDGCQSIHKKNFEVIVSGITNLKASYCTNEAPLVGAMAVSPAYVTQIMGPGWSFSHFVYFDWNASTWLPISNPSNTEFDPRLNEYFASYQTFRSYGYPGLAVGFAVCNGTVAYPCNGTSSYVPTYQWVDLKTAPNVTFNLPSTFCRNSVPVTLVGSPANSNNTTDDKFTASGGQGVSISNSLVPPVTGSQVWTFSPATVTGETPFTITYQYKDPVTGCTSTFDRSVTVFDVPTAVPSTDIIKSTPGVPSTAIKLCQGGTVGTFSATDPAYSYRWYADPVGPGNVKGLLSTFAPAVDNLVAGITSFYVTRVKNGCESITTPLALSVNVVATPVAPTPNFTDANRQYCVGAIIPSTRLGVPGTNVKWYTEFGATPISGIANANEPTPGELSISTASATSYRYRVTQTETVNSCESPASIINVSVQALPVITIEPSVDPVRICTTGGNIKFTPKDQGTAAPGINWAIVGTPAPGPGVLTNFNSIDGTVELNPLTGQPGPYTLRYTYTNGAGCSNFGERNVLILPKITPNVAVSTTCDLSPAIINNTSGGATISKASWVFGDGQIVPNGANNSYTSAIDPTLHPGITSGTYQNPRHIYPNVGTFQLSGLLTTTDGCEYAVPATSVTISPLPVANFTSRNVCVNSPTTFTATASIPIQTYEWTFAKNGVLNPGAISATNPITPFTYTQTGKDTVRMIAITSVGCRDTVEKPIYIVPNLPTINTSTSYSQDFNANNGGWVSGGRNSSWQWVTPAEAPAPVTGNAWDTKNDLVNESSWVMSGCFTFAGTKPVLSLDIWSDVLNGADGAVIQYNVDGNIEDNVPGDINGSDGFWETLGEVGSGINWYDDQGISTNPGNQSSISAGWTGRYNEWRKAIYKLDELPNGTKVVFRVAFASDQPRGNGFTFDNVFIGERSRVVLLENFTNTSVEANPPVTSAHNAVYNTFGNVSDGELVKIQYHTPFPGNDVINQNNEQMNNSRAAFYGITTAPSARLDGNFRNGTLNGWLNQSQ